MNKVLSQPNMDAAQKLVFMWVKQGIISPREMADMIVAAHKKFVEEKS